MKRLRAVGTAVVALLTATLAVTVPAPASAATTEVDQAIVNRASGRCLDADAGAYGANGTSVQLWDCLGVNQPNQRWYLRWVTAGRFQLVNKAGGRCLDATAQGNGQNGTRIQLWDCFGPGQLNQIWEPVWDTANTFVVGIRNVGSGRMLDAQAQRVGENGAPIQLWDDLGSGATNQRWESTFFKAFQPGAGTYVVHNVVTGECADVPGRAAGVAGNVVSEYTCDVTGNDNQFFRLEWYDSTRFVIRHDASSNLCFDLPGSEAVGIWTGVSLYQCLNTPADNQLWRVEQRGARNYFIVNDKSGLCLDVAGYRTGGDGARLGLYHCDETDDHLWQFR